MAETAIFGDFRTRFAICRAGHKLQNKYWNIKIGQELTSEMSKMWGNLKISQKLDLDLDLDKILKFQAYISNKQEILHKLDVVL